jgi:ankyrin repeat protein
MAARLGDVRLATSLLYAEPSCVAARINEPGYALVPPLNIYCWSLGFGLSPREVAARFGHPDVQALLLSRSPVHVRFMQALVAADEETARAVLAAHPDVLTAMPHESHGHLARATFQERYDAAELMLRLGFDPAAPGVDGGTALHAACWVGHVRLVEQILAHAGVPVDARDPTHRSTPLGWTAFGSVHRRARGADYPAVIDRLVAAGADIAAPGNGQGLTLIEMAEGNATVQSALRRHGAR